MNLTKFAVKNYQFTLIVFVMLALIGVSSMINMPRGEDPDTEAPTFSAIIIYPGTSPSDIPTIDIQRFRPSDVNILQVALLSETAPYKDLQTWSKKLKDRLEKIKTLKNVDNWAFPQQQVRVSLNLEKLAQNKIPLNTVLQAIQRENINIPAAVSTWERGSSM